MAANVKLAHLFLLITNFLFFFMQIRVDFLLLQHRLQVCLQFFQNFFMFYKFHHLGQHVRGC